MEDTQSVKHIILWALLACISCIIFVIACALSIRSIKTMIYPCNTALIPVTGMLYTSIDSTDTKEQQVDSGLIAKLLDQADIDPHIKAVVVSIDSPGGAPAAGEEIYRALRRVRKPTVVLVKSEDASSAYLASVGADTIFAESTSGVGGIGVTASYVDYSAQNAFQGITYNQVSIGKYKDMGSPDKPLTADEKNLEMSQLQELYNFFTGVIAQNRRLSITTVNTLANGATYSGMTAARNGLIDYIGTLSDVQVYLSNRIQRPVRFCRYELPYD